MKTSKKCWLGLALAAGLAPSAWAQVPAVPAAPPAAAPSPIPGAPGSPAVPAPAPGGVMGNIIKTCDYCKAKFCASQFGLLVNNSMAPINVLSGGIIPQCCPPNGVNPADLAKPADSAAGAAARIKADTADAAARRAAVRYLAHADCHYWPEAQAALIAALRADRNECVRWEAAMALGSGCCCTPKTMLALTITVSGSEEDGNPSETSERVRGAAYASLAGCLSRQPPPPPEEVIPKKEGPVLEKEGPPRELVPPPTPSGPPPAGTTKAVTPASFYERNDELTMAAVLKKAREALDKNSVQTTEATPVRVASSSRGLIGLAMESLNWPPSSMSSEPASGVPIAATPATPPTGTLTLHAVPVTTEVQPAPLPAPKPTPVIQTTVQQAPALPPPMPTPPPVIQPAVQQAPTLPPPMHSPPPAPAPLPTTSSASPTPAIRQTSFDTVTPAPQAQPRLISSYSQAPVQKLTWSSNHPETVAKIESNDPIALLESSDRIDRRLWAASQFDKLDWKSNPRVVDALMKAARSDKSAPVRLACVRALERMNVATPEVVTTFHVVAALDDDARVIEAANQALANLKGKMAPAGH
jgi:hypothetical protein